VEIHDKLIALLAEVEEFKSKEAQLHLEQIAQSEGDVQKCNDELSDIRDRRRNRRAGR
jgi:hypothetical protein